MCAVLYNIYIAISPQNFKSNSEYIFIKCGGALHDLEALVGYSPKQFFVKNSHWINDEDQYSGVFG